MLVESVTRFAELDPASANVRGALPVALKLIVLRYDILSKLGVEDELN